MAQHGTRWTKDPINIKLRSSNREYVKRDYSAPYPFQILPPEETLVLFPAHLIEIL